MELLVCYSNPNPTGPHITLIKSVVGLKVIDRELVITLDDKTEMRFASGKWVYYQTQTNGAAGSGVVDQYRQERGAKERRKSDTSDLSYPDVASIERTRTASVQFAIDNMTVPWSEAHMRALKDYERAVAEEFGPAAVDKLPWNRIPRGSDGPEER